MNSTLNIAGLTPLSTVDYPKHLAAVLFTQGCPLRCGYCHNPHLIPNNKNNELMDWSSVKKFLEKRVGFLQAVVFSGGEPTLQSTLPEAIKEVKEMGYKIGLHTAGVYPTRIEKILNDIDWIGLDVKALPENYERVTGRKSIADNVDQTLKMIMDSNIDYEVRITVHPLDMDITSIKLLIDRVSIFDVKNCVIQVARGGQVTLNPKYQTFFMPYSIQKLQDIVSEKSIFFESLFIRD